MDKQKAKEIREAAEKALAPMAEELGLQISVKRGTFDDGQITFKVEFAEIDESGTVHTKEADDFKAYCFRYGLEETDLGREFISRGETFTVIGCRPRARKMPIIATRKANGQRYTFTHDEVKRGFIAA